MGGLDPRTRGARERPPHTRFRGLGDQAAEISWARLLPQSSRVPGPAAPELPSPGLRFSPPGK